MEAIMCEWGINPFGANSVDQYLKRCTVEDMIKLGLEKKITTEITWFGRRVYVEGCPGSMSLWKLPRRSFVGEERTMGTPWQERKELMERSTLARQYTRGLVMESQYVQQKALSWPKYIVLQIMDLPHIFPIYYHFYGK
jgi:hypothetical protein